MSNLFAAIAGIFSSPATSIPLVIALMFGGLWLYERHENRDLAESNGQLLVANIGQTVAICTMQADRMLADKILIKREAEREDIRKQMADAKADTQLARQTDSTLDDWLAGALPGHVRGLFDHQDSDAGTDGEVDAAGRAAVESAGAAPGR